MKLLSIFLIVGLSALVTSAQSGETAASKMDLWNQKLKHDTEVQELRNEIDRLKYSQRPNARYDLDTGIEVAIKNVTGVGKSVTLQNVVQELKDMAKRNDVRLPCSYAPTRKTAVVAGKKVKLPDYQKRESERKSAVQAFEQRVSARIAAYYSQNPGVDSAQSLNPEPHPSQYKTRKAFAEAYATYKVKTAGDDIKAEYAKRIGGMNEYRRKMRHEAENVWAAK